MKLRFSNGKDFEMTFDKTKGKNMTTKLELDKIDDCLHILHNMEDESKLLTNHWPLPTAFRAPLKNTGHYIPEKFFMLETYIRTLIIQLNKIK